MGSERKSVSAYVDQSILEEFDEQFDCGPDGTESRAEKIEEAMRLYTGIDNAMPPDYEFGRFFEYVQWVRQAIYDEYRRENPP